MTYNTIFEAIQNNRNNKTAVTSAMIGYKEAANKEQREDISLKVSTWKDNSKNLLDKVYLYTKAAHDDESLKAAQTAVFNAYKACLNFLKYEFDGEQAKLKPQASDLTVLVAMATGYKWQKDYACTEVQTTEDVEKHYAYLETGKREFKPVGADTFRKGLEDFICDRVKAIAAKTPEELEHDRLVNKAINKARREALKKLEAEKAAKENEMQTVTVEEQAA